MKYKLIIIFATFLMTSMLFINAVPFQLSTTFDDGLTVEVSPIAYLKNSEEFKIRVYVYNTSNGFAFYDDKVSCCLRIFEEQGTKIYNESDMTISTCGKFFVSTIAGGNFTENENYHYSVCCNSTTNTGGYRQGVFEVNLSGVEFTEARAILYIGLMGMLIFLFIINLIVIPLLPSKDNYDEEGTLISINQLKYLRPILYVTAYLLLMSLMFVSSNIAFAYLGTDLIGDLLFNIFQIMMVLALPMVVIWFIYILASIFQDREMKRYLERGIIT